MTKTKISIITVVKNGMPFLKESIKSFNKQTLKQKEHIIVFSPSIDGTESYLKKIKNKKIIKDNLSSNKFGALNLGIKKANGELIGILHADDMYPDKNTLKSIYNFYKKNKTDVVYGNIKFCKKKNIKQIIRYWKSEKFVLSQLKYGWMPPHTSLFIKKTVIKKIKYNINYPISGDYKFILDIFSNVRIKKKYFNRLLCIMRLGGDSTKLKFFFKKLQEDIKIAKSFFKNYYICIFFKIIRKFKQFNILKNISFNFN